MTAEYGTEEHDAEVEQRLLQWQPELNAAGSHQQWWARKYIRATLRYDRCWKKEKALRFRRSRRALELWQEDREKQIADVAAALKRRPQRVVAELRCSPQGCAWLEAEFRALAALIAGDGGPARPLDEKHRELAYDLLGLTAVQREVRTPLDPPRASGTPDAATIAAHQLALMTRKIDELVRLKNELLEHDELDRHHAIDGFDTLPDPELRRVDRYQDAATRDAEKARNELRCLQASAPPPTPEDLVIQPDTFGSAGPPLIESPEAVPDPEPEPEPEREPEPEPATERVPASAAEPAPVVPTPPAATPRPASQPEPPPKLDLFSRFFSPISAPATPAATSTDRGLAPDPPPKPELKPKLTRRQRRNLRKQR
jgi:hypothetical protein